MFHKENPEYNRRQVGFYTLDELVPKDHFLRKVEETIDFSFIYDLVEDSYSSDNGRPSLDPVLLVKIPLIQCFYGIRSMRQTIKDIEVNTAYRWFLGLSLDDKVPHFTTYGKNYSRRFENKEVLAHIFSHVLHHVLEAGLIDPSEIFIDGTHIKASATTNRDGYREYKSRAYLCKTCPTRGMCTESAKCEKTFLRHIWQEYVEMAEDIRHMAVYRELYRLRKEKIERVFADAKEKHGMRYTQYRGLAQVTNWVKLKFAAMNLKKLATWKWRNLLSSFRFAVFSLIYVRDPVCS